MEKKKCYIIAEAGLNHNGNHAIARRLIDVATIAGADAVKFQKRDVDMLAVEDVLDAPDDRFPGLGSTYREIRRNLEFDFETYRQLKKYTEEKGLDFICTAFDMPSVDFLESINLQTYKLASHSITNLPLLEYIANKNKRIIFSTGMCTFDEIDQAVEILQKSDREVIMLHCVSSYPQPPEDSNLRLIQALRDRYGLPVGYSGHEQGYLPTLVAVALEAVAVERHFTLDKTMEGFDHRISLEPQELIALVKDIRTIEKTLGTTRKEISGTEWITRRKYHVSMVSACPIPVGTEITVDMVTYKNPGTGIQPKDAHKIFGKMAVQDIASDTMIDYIMVNLKDA